MTANGLFIGTTDLYLSFASETKLYRILAQSIFDTLHHDLKVLVDKGFFGAYAVCGAVCRGGGVDPLQIHCPSPFPP